MGGWARDLVVGLGVVNGFGADDDETFGYLRGYGDDVDDRLVAALAILARGERSEKEVASAAAYPDTDDLAVLAAAIG